MSPRLPVGTIVRLRVPFDTDRPFMSRYGRVKFSYIEFQIPRNRRVVVQWGDEPRSHTYDQSDLVEVTA